MPRVNRREVLSETEVQIVHCTNRCVRRAYLCGTDPITGANYESRKIFIRKRMEFLASAVAVEILGYAIMSNHFHVILRTRPDLVAEWTDREVAQRWWRLCPGRRDGQADGSQVTERELTAMQENTEKIAEWRARLSSVSWFMWFLDGEIAREANRQDDCTGRFWEGRFRAQVILDEAGLLACMQYVDLNPIRAGLTQTPEDSEFTSAHDRILDVQQAAAHETEKTPVKEIEHGRHAGWIQPMALEPRRPAARSEETTRRCSNKGCLPIELNEYLALLDWTGRQVRSDKPGSIPEKLAPLLTRLKINGPLWVECVRNFRKWFRGRVGRPAAMEADASQRGRTRVLSLQRSRDVFA